MQTHRVYSDRVHNVRGRSLTSFDSLDLDRYFTMSNKIKVSLSCIFTFGSYTCFGAYGKNLERIFTSTLASKSTTRSRSVNVLWICYISIIYNVSSDSENKQFQVLSHSVHRLLFFFFFWHVGWNFWTYLCLLLL